jgi:DNA-binding NarL/FixJ family response regulator
MMNLRILLVDDHEVERLGVRALIDDQPGMTVVGEAGTARKAVRQASELVPDIFVLDIRLPDGNDVDACRRIKADLPETRILILTSFPDEEVIMDASKLNLTSRAQAAAYAARHRIEDYL